MLHRFRRFFIFMIGLVGLTVLVARRHGYPLLTAEGYRFKSPLALELLDGSTIYISQVRVPLFSQSNRICGHSSVMTEYGCSVWVETADMKGRWLAGFRSTELLGRPRITHSSTGSILQEIEPTVQAIQQ